MKKETINIKAAIFDMDGTLYRLDGENGLFLESTLYRSIIANSIKFVSKRESDLFDAQSLVAEAMKDSVGISRVLAQRYKITRKEYFEEAWNIDPELIINGSDIAVAALINLRTNFDLDLVLLTAAPRRWMLNVTEFLNIGNLFTKIYTAEDFGSKDEIFVQLAERYQKKAVSIGDQENTDILPAKAVGLFTFQVKHPNDLSQLPTFINQI